MKVMRVFLLLIILVVLYVGLMLAQVGLGARATLVSPDYYTGVLRGHGFFETLPDAVLATFGDQFSDAPSSEMEKLESSLREALAPDWVEGRVSAILRDVSSYVRGKSPALTAVIPLGQMKDRFIDAYSKVGSPQVTAELRRNIDLRDVALAEFVQESHIYGLSPELLGHAAPLLAMASVLPYLLVGLWLLLAILCFPLAAGIVGGTRWLGTAFLLSGLTGVFASVSIKLVSSTLLAGLTPPPEFSRLPIREVAVSLVDGVLAVVRNNGLIFVGVGVALFIVAGLVARGRARRLAGRETASTPVVAPTPDVIPSSSAEAVDTGKEPPKET